MPDYTRYPEAFTAAGIPFTEEPGWRDRGHGDVTDTRFIVIHHTASANNDAAGIGPVRDGVSGLAGPLSQLCLKRDGTPHIIAAGVSWHAYGNISYRGVAPKMGNYYSIGIEGIDSGYNTWTDQQRDMYPKVVAALLKDMGLPADAWIFHRDYQPGEKIDPGGFDKAWFDRQVRAAYNGIVTETAIQAKRRENPWLGNRVIKEEERPTLDGIGRYAQYESGYIYWHPNTGAVTINLDFWPRFEQERWEQGDLGYPVKDAQAVEGGSFQVFQNGNVLVLNGATKVVSRMYGLIGGRWNALGGVKSELGFPVREEITLPDGEGRLAQFDHGHIYWHPRTGVAKDILNDGPGGTWEEFVRLDYEKGPLGYPVGDSILSLDGRAKIQAFEHGTIYNLFKTEKIDAHAVWGQIFAMYAQLGYENGRLGLPISDVYRNGELLRCDFEAGSIEWNDKTNDIYMVISGKRVDIPLPKPEVPVEKPVAPGDPNLIGKQALDFSVNQIPAKDIKAGGYVAVIHYVSDPREPWMKAKPSSSWYCKNLSDNGIWNVSNFQYGKGSTSDWRTGYANGVKCAQRALELHKACGGPDDAPIYASIDDNPSTNEMKDLIKPYLEGWASVIGKGRLGVYGNYGTIQFCVDNNLVSYYWQHGWGSPKNPDGSWKRHPASHILQDRIDKDTVGGIGVDVNIILKSYFGQWKWSK